MANWRRAAGRAPKGRSRDDWRTPEEVMSPVREFLGRIDLDPCAGAEADLADVNYEGRPGRGDGLADDWFGRCYANPPYSRLRAFVAKAAAEHAAGRTYEVVVLMPTRTDTRAWHDHVATAAAACFWRGRVTFVGAPDPCPFPLVLPYWGPRVADFERVFSRVGMVVRLPRDPLL